MLKKGEKATLEVQTHDCILQLLHELSQVKPPNGTSRPLHHQQDGLSFVGSPFSDDLPRRYVPSLPVQTGIWRAKRKKGLTSGNHQQQPRFSHKGLK